MDSLIHLRTILKELDKTNVIEGLVIKKIDEV